MSLGKRLKQLRKSIRKTQQEVAKDLGISRARYSHFENDRNEPDSEMLKKLAEYYNVSADYLLGKEEDQVVDLLEVIENRPHARDPKTGRLIPIGPTEAKIIRDIILGYFERNYLPFDEDKRSSNL